MQDLHFSHNSINTLVSLASPFTCLLWPSLARTHASTHPQTHISFVNRLFINPSMQKTVAFICLLTNKGEGMHTERWGAAPGSHPVWTCHIEGCEKTVPLMDAEREASPRDVSFPLSLSVLLHLWGRKEDVREGKRWEVRSKNRESLGIKRKTRNSVLICSERPDNGDKAKPHLGTRNKPQMRWLCRGAG